MSTTMMSTSRPRDRVLDVRAVLFDMDGTLVDSTEVVETLWGQFASTHGLALPEVLAFAHGRQGPDVVGHFLPPGDDIDEAIAELWTAELQTVTGIEEVPGARTLLASLDGAPYAVVTSARRELAHIRLAAAGLPLPPVLIAAEDVPAGKPDPAGFLRAARTLGVRPQDCAAFEDAEAGVRAAVASGAQTFVVGRHTSPTTQRLHRFPDMHAVEVATTTGAGIQLRW